MELRGITGVLAPEEIVPGRFLLPDHEGGLLLCLRVALPEAERESKSWMSCSTAFPDDTGSHLSVRLE